MGNVCPCCGGPGDYEMIPGELSIRHVNSQRSTHEDAVTHKESVREPYLEEAFAILDDDNSGKVSLSELVEFGKFTGNQHWTEEEMADLLNTIDKDGDKALSMSEFKSFAHEQTAHHSNTKFTQMLSGFLEVAKMRTGKSERFDLIKQVYDKIDLDHNMRLDKYEMKEFGKFMNASFDDDKCAKLMDQMDLDGDGYVSFEEFTAYFAKLAKGIEDDQFMKGIKKYLKFEKGPKEGSK